MTWVLFIVGLIAFGIGTSCSYDAYEARRAWDSGLRGMMFTGAALMAVAVIVRAI